MLWSLWDSNSRPIACKAIALANWAKTPNLICGPAQVWTVDLRLMRPLLYLLSYRSDLVCFSIGIWRFPILTQCVDLRQVKQTTHFSIFLVTEILPTQECPSSFVLRFLCARRDSNPHTLRHQILSLTCLPIPPQAHISSLRSCSVWRFRTPCQWVMTPT